jgi:DnaK suppressor protein
MKKSKNTNRAVLPNPNGEMETAPATGQAVADRTAASPNAAASTNGHTNGNGNERHQLFLQRQKAKLLELRDAILDTVSTVSRDTLREPSGGDGASVFGTHQADAGSDAYDRDFAVSILAQEQDALYEIEEALKRIEEGTYGVCEISGKPIAHVRLEAIPFTRFTVECQGQIERQNKAHRVRQPVVSIFGRSEDDEGEPEEEEAGSELKDGP